MKRDTEPNTPLSDLEEQLRAILRRAREMPQCNGRCGCICDTNGCRMVPDDDCPAHGNQPSLADLMGAGARVD